MEISQIERAAVAAAQPTVPLSAMLDALASLRAAKSLTVGGPEPVGYFVELIRATAALAYYIDKIFAAQSVGVTA